MRAETYFILLAIILSQTIPGYYTNKVKRGDESKYTDAEQQALVKLRELVKDALYRDYMHRDEYLIAWLRARGLDVNKANEMLRASLKWRNEEKIDDLENEDFPQFEKTYPTDLKGRDKEGRPIVLWPYSAWDTRKAVVGGQMPQLIRYMLKHILEVPNQIARREGQADGTNATQVIPIVDVTGYNLRQHACIRCFELYTAVVQNYEANYPQTNWQSIIVGTPSIFTPVVTLVKPFFSKHFSDNLHILGPDKKEWKKYLDHIIDPAQLPKRFGGSDSRVV